MKTRAEIPQILEQDMREVEEVEGKGLRVLESVIHCLRVDYDLFYTKEDLIHKVIEEMLTNPNQGQFFRGNINPFAIKAEYQFGAASHVYGKVMGDICLRTVANALNITIRTIMNVHGYYAVMNIHPTNLSTEANLVINVL